MRDRTATTILWTESIFHIIVWPVLRQYFVYSGIVFNVFLILLILWR